MIDNSFPTMLRHAFDLRRAWTGAVGKTRLREWLNHVDILAVALFVLLRRAEGLAVQDEGLAADLSAVFALVPAFQHVVIRLMDTSSDATLALVDVNNSADLGTPRRETLLYGSRSGIPLSSSSSRPDENTCVIPFSFCSPVFWQSGLLWCGPRDLVLNKSDGPLIEIARLVNGEWLDPLKLFEEGQRRRDRGISEGDAPGDLAALTEQIQILEERIRELEQIGLVRHELLLAKVALRERLSS